jgi:3-dehydroquinate synthase
LVSQPRIFKAVGGRLKNKFPTVLIPNGERAKTLATVTRLLDRMVQLKLTRQSAVIAVGGGVVGDVAGFAASIYMRGVPVIQVPTTLLAQVDSSIGGKTGVNHRAGKNLIGTFYQPRLVISDPLVLKTLPEREYTSGLYEALKYGVIRDAELFRDFEQKHVTVNRTRPRGSRTAGRQVRGRQSGRGDERRKRARRTTHSEFRTYRWSRAGGCSALQTN